MRDQNETNSGNGKQGWYLNCLGWYCCVGIGGSGIRFGRYKWELVEWELLRWKLELYEIT